MKQAVLQLKVETNGIALYDITSGINKWVAEQNISTGLLTVFIKHTSASLIISENADPDVQTDLVNYFKRTVPHKERYLHSSEGPDDMPAHIKSALTAVSLSIPVIDSRPVMGIWQGVYLFEHRTSDHTRKIILHISGE
jgi:secondary thiamine-phosphate synthase enzyme